MIVRKGRVSVLFLVACNKSPRDYDPGATQARSLCPPDYTAIKQFHLDVRLRTIVAYITKMEHRRPFLALKALKLRERDL